MVARGEVDLSTAAELEDRLREALASADEVVLDLSGVEFIDSRGVSAIIWAMRAAEASGKSFKISPSLSPQARRLFELVGLLPRLPLDDDQP